MRWAALVAMTLVGCTGDALVDDNAVASAGTATLSVDRLAEMMVNGRNVPLAPEVAERLAHRWVEFTLFASRLGAGDSLLDSGLVLQAMWPEVNQAIVDAFQERLVAERIAVSDPLVDSVYAAGDHRLIKHILVGVTARMSSTERANARRRALRIRETLARGGSWDVANRENEDVAAKANGGSLGVITKGQLLVEVEDAAFALRPGELSEVVETSLGYHVMYRPPLAEVRGVFTGRVQQIMTDRMGDAYLSQLLTDWDVRVGPEAAPRMREAAAAPLRALTSDVPLGSHREGRFTVADFVRWLQVLPLTAQQQVATATNAALEDMARSMIRNEALVLEARSRGVTLDGATFAEVRDRLAGEIAVVRDALDAGGATTPGMTAERYVTHLVNNPEGAVTVPTFLADALRQRGKWRVAERALPVVVERARLMAMQQSVPQANR